MGGNLNKSLSDGAFVTRDVRRIVLRYSMRTDTPVYLKLMCEDQALVPYVEIRSI